MAAAGRLPSVVGALACQRDSYLQSLEAEVISCAEYEPPRKQAAAARPNTKKATDPEKAAVAVGSSDNIAATSTTAWLLEFSDSVLFPEGGGQPSDHGSITPLGAADATDIPIPITNLQRHGLRCLAFSPRPLEAGTQVRQCVDFRRRWDHMQQHTGQHLLSAVMDTMGLETLAWAMGAAGEMNYVELPRKPREEELRAIQAQCNEVIRSNAPITVETPGGDAKADSLPGDYDTAKGVVRFIRIGDLDYNACCGTHLKQTSHIQLILLHHTQTVRATNCRLFFSCGDRAIALATSSLTALRSIAVSLSSNASPSGVQSSVQRLSDLLSDARKKEKKLLTEIAQFEGSRIKAELASGKVGWCHRATDGLDFLNLVVFEIRDAVKEHGAVVLASGQERETGSIIIMGEKSLVEALAAKVKAIVPTVKGGGKGEKWQGKVVAWKKGEIEALRIAAQE